MWNEIKTPIIIAHRGDSAHAPENTLAAFQSAVKKGAEAVEFDVKLSQDGQVIVIHDQTVDRTTDGQGDVRHLSLAQLKQLDADILFKGQYPAERIPTLDEVFEAVGTHLHMNVELTNYATPADDLVEKVCTLVRGHQMQARVLFSSFFPRNLRQAQALLPEVPCGLLAWSGVLGLPARTWGWRRNLHALHPHVSDVSASLVTRLHAAGMRLNTWTVNAVPEMERLLGLGVDGIFTDDPASLARVLGRQT
jgi:glycerophosphoryl diester phosphodiesterase